VFTAAERGLQPDDRIASSAGEALQHAAQYPLQAFGQEGDAEEAFRRRIVIRYRTGSDRAEIGGKVRFLETIGDHVRVRKCHLDPGPQGPSPMSLRLPRWMGRGFGVGRGGSTASAAPGADNPECRCSS